MSEILVERVARAIHGGDDRAWEVIRTREPEHYWGWLEAARRAIVVIESAIQERSQ